MLVLKKGGDFMYYSTGGFDIMFTIVPLIVFCGFCFVFGTMIFSGVRYLNDKSKPMQTERARVISKRTNVSRHHHHGVNDHVHHSTSTTYYVTFEFLSGQRMELKVPANQFGYMVEGDDGILQFQGQLFNSFERVPKL